MKAQMAFAGDTNVATKNEAVYPLNDLGRNPLDIRIHFNKDQHLEKLSNEMQKAKSIRPVLRGKLEGYESYILNTCFSGDYEKAKMAIAMIGVEATYGESKMAIEKNNFFGIKRDGNFISFATKEEGLCKMKEHVGLYVRLFKECSQFKFYEECMNEVFIPYCVDEDGIECIHVDKNLEDSKKSALFEIFYSL